MEICVYEDELRHHGIRGQQWGIRRYQNKDGSLTKAGQKRYNKEMGELKEEQKALKAKIRAQKKLGKLDSMKSENEELKKQADDKESVEVKRERLLKSTDAKDLYKNRDLLTTAELNERINRIDTESRLQSKIQEERAKTGMEKVNETMDRWSNNVNKVTNLYKSVDSAYSTVSSSAIGKTLAKKMGLEPPKKEFNINDIWKKRNSLSDDDVNKANKRLQNYVNMQKNMDTLNGKKTDGNKNSGMSEDDVRAYIEQYLEENGGT